MDPLPMSRKQWYDEIWKLSASGTAKKYDIPYAQFMQQIKASGIPIPPSGYWTKISFGKPVEVIPLPGDPKELLAICRKLPKRKQKNQPEPMASIVQTSIEKTQSDTPIAVTVTPVLQKQLDTLDFLSDEERGVLGAAVACVRIPNEKERMLPAIIAHRKIVTVWKKEHKNDGRCML